MLKHYSLTIQQVKSEKTFHRDIISSDEDEAVEDATADLEKENPGVEFEIVEIERISVFANGNHVF